MPWDEEKKRASLKALEFVQDGMLLGLGTGSTAAFFIDFLIKKCAAGLQIKAIATSSASEEIARQGNIALLAPDQVTSLDLTIDGADEIDPQKRLIKGAGGALVREKIVAAMSKKMIVIGDESKLVPSLGHTKLPVEIIPFGASSTQKHIHQLNKEISFQSRWRLRKNSSSYYMTENHNWILDLFFTSSLSSPEQLHEKLLSIPGVVDTGFFFGLAHTIIIGNKNGSVVVHE